MAMRNAHLVTVLEGIGELLENPSNPIIPLPKVGSPNEICECTAAAKVHN